MTNSRYVYTGDKQITATEVQNANNFIWLAFAQNTAGNCLIEKQWAFMPTQTFFSLERAVSAIPAMTSDTTKLYVAYNDTTLLGEFISLTNPLTSTTNITIPGGITEAPVDIQTDGTNVWYLIPGDASGTNTKLLRYNTSGVLQETVDLSKSGVPDITNARSFTIDNNNDLWIVTFTSPAQLVRVFALSGGGYDFDSTDMV